MKEKFTAFVARSEMSNFCWETCRCGESIIQATVTASQKAHSFNTQPVGGTEMDRIYEKHFCQPKEDES